MGTSSNTRNWSHTAFTFIASLCLLFIPTLFLISSSNKHEVVIDSYPWQPDKFDVAVEDAAFVVEATVKEVLQPQWTTPDGNSPKDPAEILSNLDVQLRTPVILSIERVLKGNLDTKEIMFTFMGGTDGEYRVRQEEDRSLSLGSRVLIFLGEAPEGSGPWAKISPYYPQLYFIIEGDTLQGPISTVDKQAVVEQIQVVVEQLANEVK